MPGSTQWSDCNCRAAERGNRRERGKIRHMIKDTLEYRRGSHLITQKAEFNPVYIKGKQMWEGSFAIPKHSSNQTAKHFWAFSVFYVAYVLTRQKLHMINWSFAEISQRKVVHVLECANLVGTKCLDCLQGLTPGWLKACAWGNGVKECISYRKITTSLLCNYRYSKEDGFTVKFRACRDGSHSRNSVHLSCTLKNPHCSFVFDSPLYNRYISINFRSALENGLFFFEGAHHAPVRPLLS